jgi:protein-disulfide isomerase/uncharacterized membrane protein
MLANVITESGFMLKRLKILFVLNILGAALSVYLTKHFYAIRGGYGSFKSFCNISEGFNCDLVASSPFAQILPGYPLSSFAAGWLIVTAIITLFGKNAFWRRETDRALFALTLGSVIFSAGYFIIMAFVVQSYCLVCLGMDAANILSFGIVLSLKPEGFKEHPLDKGKWKTFLSIFVITMVATVFGLKTIDESRVSKSSIEETFSSIISGSPVSISMKDSYPVIGDKNAPITIVEFSDFQCPFCKFGAITMHTLWLKYGGEKNKLFKIVHRNFPLDMGCNRLVKHNMHKFACEASRAALCANYQGKFKETFELIFENQATLAAGKASEWAKSTGLNATQFDTCMNSADVSNAVSKDVDEGEQLGIQSTPTFFINGRRVEGLPEIEVWDKLIDYFKKNK